MHSIAKLFRGWDYDPRYQAFICPEGHLVYLATHPSTIETADEYDIPETFDTMISHANKCIDQRSCGNDNEQ